MHDKNKKGKGTYTMVNRLHNNTEKKSKNLPKTTYSWLTFGCFHSSTPLPHPHHMKFCFILLCLVTC